jgi:hypothetical protein
MKTLSEFFNHWDAVKKTESGQAGQTASIIDSDSMSN